MAPPYMTWRALVTFSEVDLSRRAKDLATAFLLVVVGFP